MPGLHTQYDPAKMRKHQEGNMTKFSQQRCKLGWAQGRRDKDNTHLGKKKKEMTELNKFKQK
jgi:hypothetical protein